MSDRVHRTVRPTLPEGYQYGDAARAPRAYHGNLLVVDPYAPRCGHRNQMATQWKLVVLADGTTEREIIPLKLRVRSADAYYCLECSQFIDAADAAEADAQRTGDETL